MNFLSKVSKSPPPTSTSPVEPSPPYAKATEAEQAMERQDSYRHVDAEAEKRLVRKMDWRIPPLVAALYLLAFLDRSNIGNAKIAGMTESLSLAGNRYQWLLNIFYISYIVFEPLNLLWKVLPPHIWCSCVVLVWGLVASLQAATQTWAAEMACRFFLGVAEAGFGPGIPYLLSFFYLRHELGLRIGIFFSAAPLATTFSGALAYGITSGHSKLQNWRLLFLVEGLPTLCMVPVVFFFLPDSPDKARFLTAEEKLIAKARGVRQVGDGPRVGGVVFKDIWAALKDYKNFLTALMYFSCNVSFSSLPVFLPTILNEMGFTAINAQGLTAPPYFVAFLVTIGSAYIADRTQQRGLTVLTLSLIGAAGYIILASTISVPARYFGVFLAAAGVFPAIANILPWVLNNQGSDTRRGMGIVMLNLIGQCGPLLGTNVFPESDSPRYIKGQSICAAFMIFNGLLALTLRTLLARENRKLEREEEEIGGRVDPEMSDGRSGERGDMQKEEVEVRERESMVGEENYGSGFRYVL